MPYVPAAKRQIIDALLASGQKRCCHCGEIKAVADFTPQKRDKTGLRPECKICHRIGNNAQYQKHREARLQRQREFRKTEPRRLYSRNYQRNRHQRMRLEMATRPKPEACEVCGQSGPVFYDHDHSTGKRIGRFRGWLCVGCNSALGYARDNPRILRDLADYLERQEAH